MIKNPTYKFYQFDHTRADGTKSVRVVAVSSFAGKPVKGYADCHPNDEFDLEFGMALAAARCAEKIAEKRCKRAYAKVDEAQAQVVAALNHLKKMMKYESDAEATFNMAAFETEALLAYKCHASQCECGCDCDCENNCECGCHN